jgi:hypothetical protein
MRFQKNTALQRNLQRLAPILMTDRNQDRGFDLRHDVIVEDHIIGIGGIEERRWIAGIQTTIVVNTQTDGLTAIDRLFLDDPSRFRHDLQHHMAVLPLRWKIMQIGGVTDCYIAQHVVSVGYIPCATDVAELERRVIEIFEDAQDDGFFPLCHDKKIQLTLID